MPLLDPTASARSTLLFNEWIALTEELEETRTAIGREVFRQFVQGDVGDPVVLDKCRKIKALYDAALKQKKELQDGLVGDDADPAAAGAVAKGKRAVFDLVAGQSDSGFKGRALHVAGAVGQHCVDVYEECPVLLGSKHLKICRYADRLREDADKKWHEIQNFHRERTGIRPMLHLLFVQCWVQMLMRSGRSRIRPWIYKILKYDPKVERGKLRKKYQGKTEVTDPDQLEAGAEPAAP